MEIGEIHFTGFEDNGVCWWCGGDLPKRRRRWCCDEHRDLYWDTYNWTYAMRACLKRENYTCQNCHRTQTELDSEIKNLQLTHNYYYASMFRYKYRLEVHHTIPLDGEDRAWHELNRPDNLITLCHNCHLLVHAAMRDTVKSSVLDPWELARAVGQGVMELEIRA